MHPESMICSKFLISELGEDIALRYMSEEYVERVEFEKKRCHFDKITVGQFLQMWKDSQPWHNTDPVDWKSRFEQEAAEPWHSSLRIKFQPDPEISQWFNLNPSYFEWSVRILQIVYQNEKDRERANRLLRRSHGIQK